MRPLRSLSWMVACASVGIGGAAHAGSIQGRVTAIVVRASDGLHYVTIEGVRSSPPACATHDYFMIADEHSDSGKSQIAILLSAYMSGKSVHIEGTGTCTRWPDGEDILVVTLS